MRLIIADWPTAAVGPSGSPATARRWFSNWLVTAPSMVQCPELWTRGAISFASNSPPVLEQLDRQHADVIELVQQPRAMPLGASAAVRR